MVQWFVYRNGKKIRKARPDEIPKGLECGVSLDDGVLVLPDKKKEVKKSGKP